MLWCAVVWCGVVWRSVVSCSVVWGGFGVGWGGMAWAGIIIILSFISHAQMDARFLAGMSYPDFVYFMLAEEDRGTPTALKYW